MTKPWPGTLPTPSQIDSKAYSIENKPADIPRQHLHPCRGCGAQFTCFCARPEIDLVCSVCDWTEYPEDNHEA